MHEAHEVLIRVAEAHASAYAALEERCRAREVERYHTLVLVPDVHHAIELVVTRFYLIYIEQGIPVLAEFGESLVHLLGGIELGDEGVSLLLIDDLWGRELLLLFVFDIAKEEHEVARLARLEGDLDIVGGDGAPAVGMTVAGLALHDCLRIGKFVVETYESLAIGIEALYLSVYMIEGIVIAALAIFGLMIDGRALNLNFASREVALEILHVGSGIPETPLLEAEELQALGFRGFVLQRQFLHLSPLLQWHEEQYAGLDAVFLTRDAGIAHTVTALVEVERRLTGFPSRIPDGVAILDVEVTAAIVHRHVVIAITGDTAELGVLVKTVSTCGIRDERKEVLVAQIIDPGPRSLRVSNNILSMLVIEVSVTFLLFHMFVLV